MGVTINKKSTTTEPPPLNGQQPKPLTIIYTITFSIEYKQQLMIESAQTSNIFAGRYCIPTPRSPNTLFTYFIVL